ncbi:hypothetical protein CF161_19659 [Pseudomonas sp. CF161]|nr:hypothetical protein CF161_19659 [Pseudomonas sp. CF161]
MPSGLFDMPQDSLDAIRHKVAQMPLSAAPLPWRLVTEMAAGSLLEVGFDRDLPMLLVTSSAGRSVIDCHSGEKIARDYREGFDSDLHLETPGIGPLAGKTLRMSGINGGGLLLGTHDGWMVESVTLCWPEQHLLLLAPGSWLYGDLHDRPGVMHKLAIEREMRAFGFSPCGTILVLASNNELTIYRRDLSPP